MLFALLVLKTTIGQKVFQTLGGVINRLLDFAFVGSAVTLALVWRSVGHIAHADQLLQEPVRS